MSNYSLKVKGENYEEEFSKLEKTLKIPISQTHWIDRRALYHGRFDKKP